MITKTEWEQMSWVADRYFHAIETRNHLTASRLMEDFDAEHRVLANHMHDFYEYKRMYDETGKIHVVKRRMSKTIMKNAEKQIVAQKAVVDRCMVALHDAAKEAQPLIS